MKKGDAARLIQPTIEGVIVSTRYNEETLAIDHLIQWVDLEGETHQRWFAEAELEDA